MEKNTDTEALKSLRDAAIERDRANVAVERAVHAARATGATWAEIAMPLGITRQAAQQKYSKSSPELIAADRAEDREILAKYKAANTDTKPETPSIFVDPLAPAKRRTEREVLDGYAAARARKADMPELCPGCGQRWHADGVAYHNICTETQNDHEWTGRWPIMANAEAFKR